jgi:hypothetical protein
MGVRFRTRGGQLQHDYCSSCRADGILRRQQYTNGVWHVHFFCPYCNRSLSGSIAREILHEQDIIIKALPIQPSWEEVRERKARTMTPAQKLRALPYVRYLQTEHWMKVRQQALEYADFRCMICNRETDLQVHHRTYDRLGEEQPNDVIALCSDCHKKHHNKHK